jgi:hypothetical protein
MKRFFATLILLSGYADSVCQTESFDIATFVAPKGWQRLESNGALVFQDYRPTENGRTMFCQIVIFPSRTSKLEPIKNFHDEWMERVAKSTGTTAIPQAQTEKTPEGWTVVSGITNISYQNATYTCILVSVSGFDRVMSVLVNLAGEEYPAQIQGFLETFELNKKMEIATKGAESVSDPPANSGLDNYIFSVPEKWFANRTRDYIMLTQSQANELGCTITILPLQRSSGDIETDARSVFNQMYSGWQFRLAGERQYDISKGYTLQGLEYCLMEAPMSKISADGSRYDGFEDGGALVIKAGSQIVMVAVRHATVLAHNDCLNKYETWKRFFNTFTVKKADIPQRIEEESSKRIVGVWKLISNGPALGEYVFAANGNYQLAGAIGTSSTTRDDYFKYIHIKSYAFEGDGSFSIQGNQLYFSKRGDKDPEQVQFRFEKINHGDTGWKDRLYMLKTDPVLGGKYEVCYERSDG